MSAQIQIEFWLRHWSLFGSKQIYPADMHKSLTTSVKRRLVKSHKRPINIRLNKLLALELMNGRPQGVLSAIFRTLQFNHWWFFTAYSVKDVQMAVLWAIPELFLCRHPIPLLGHAGSPLQPRCLLHTSSSPSSPTSSLWPRGSRDQTLANEGWAWGPTSSLFPQDSDFQNFPKGKTKEQENPSQNCCLALVLPRRSSCMYCRAALLRKLMVTEMWS